MNNNMKSPILLKRDHTDSLDIERTKLPKPVKSVLPKPSVTHVTREKTPTFLIGLLSMLLVATYIFTLKFYEPAKNILIMGSVVVYPFTFLITMLISRYYGFKECRKAIFMSAGLYLCFALIMMVALFPPASKSTMQYNAIVQYVFANNIVNVGSTSFYYPTMGQFLGVVVSFVISHLLVATIYNAIHKYTVEYLAAGLSLFIGYIIDRIILVMMLYAKGLRLKKNTFDFVIRALTSEFMVSIVMVVLIVIVYIVITKIKKSKID